MVKHTPYALGFLAGGCFAMGAAFAMHRWAGIAFGLVIVVGAREWLEKERSL